MEVAAQFQHRGHVHRRREGVVRRLAAVDVIVGMNGRFAAQRLAGELIGAIGDDLVGVHVAVRAAAGLKDDEGEVIVELAFDHLLGGAYDELGQFPRQFSQLGIGLRRRFLENAKRADDGQRHTVVLHADGEVLQRALGLRAPVAVGRDPDFPQRVGFAAFVHGYGLQRTESNPL
jgi:hypothetical protein